MIVNDIIIVTTYILEHVIMSILEPKVYHEIALWDFTPLFGSKIPSFY